MHKDSTYRINVYTFNKTLEFSDRLKRIDVSILDVCVSVEMNELVHVKTEMCVVYMHL